VAAAEQLLNEDIACEVVEMRFIKPLDVELLLSVWDRHRLVITLEENSVLGGFGAAVLEWAAQSSGAGGPQVKVIGIPDKFQEHASRPELLADLGLDTAGIAASVRRLMREIDAENRGTDSQAQNAS